MESYVNDQSYARVFYHVKSVVDVTEGKPQLTACIELVRDI